MKLHQVLLLIGIAILTIGIYLSSFLTTGLVIIGTVMAVIGGGLTGISNYYSISSKKKC